METHELTKHKRGQQLQVAERNVLIAKMMDLMTQGYMSTNQLAKKLRVAHSTIESYRPLCDELIGKTKVDRNAIRALQIKRTYGLIEQLMEDLKACESIKDRTLLYNQIYKFSSHLALITGLNVETQVHIDPTKLVIIRSNQRKNTEIIDTTPTEL